MKHKNILYLSFLLPLLTSCSFNILDFFKVNKNSEQPTNNQESDTEDKKDESAIDLKTDYKSIRLCVSDAYSLAIGKAKKQTRAPEDPLPLSFLKQKIEKFTDVNPELTIDNVGLSQIKKSYLENTYLEEHLAKRKEDDFCKIEETIFNDDEIIIKTDSTHSYRIINYEFSDDSNWIMGNGDYISYKVNEKGKGKTSEYKTYIRSEDAVITIFDQMPMTYLVKDKDGNTIAENLKENDSIDACPEKGKILIDGLTENETYYVQKTGYVEEDEINNESLGFGIERAYVYSPEYTFIYFVGKGQSQRGESGRYETTDMAGAELRDWAFYNVQSVGCTFVLENSTGRLLPIRYDEPFRIYNRVITNGTKMLDFSIENDEVVLTDSGVVISSGARDKYGNRLVQGSYSFCDKERKLISIDGDYVYFASNEMEIFRQKRPDLTTLGSLEKLNQNLDFMQLTESDNATSLLPIFYEGHRYRDCVPQQIKNGKVYYGPVSMNPVAPDKQFFDQNIWPKYLYAERDYNEDWPSIALEFDISDEQKQNYFFNFNYFIKYDLVICDFNYTIYQIKNLKKYLQLGGSTNPYDILRDTEILQLQMFKFDRYDHFDRYVINEDGVERTVIPIVVIEGENAHYDMVEEDMFAKEVDRLYFQQVTN